MEPWLYLLTYVFNSGRHQTTSMMQPTRYRALWHFKENTLDRWWADRVGPVFITRTWYSQYRIKTQLLTS